jgi:serine/threonine protein kinase
MATPFDRIKTALADHYEIERELGHGAMATVYLARDLKLNRRSRSKSLSRI